MSKKKKLKISKDDLVTAIMKLEARIQLLESLEKKR